MDKNDEIRKMIDQASDGIWFPLAVVSFTFGIVIALLLYIWKQSQITNNKRHNQNENLISTLSNNAIEQTAINTRLETLVVRNPDDIKELKQNMK